MVTLEWGNRWFLILLTDNQSNVPTLIELEVQDSRLEVPTIVSLRTRRLISMTLVPTPIKPGSVIAVASSAARAYYC